MKHMTVEHVKITTILLLNKSNTTVTFFFVINFDVIVIQ